MFCPDDGCPSGQPGQGQLASGAVRTTPFLPDQLKAEDFLILPQVLGKGASATVKLAIHRPTQTQYAVKRVSLTPAASSTTLQQAQTELSLQEALAHPQLLQVFGHFTDDACLNLVLELVPGQTLFSLIQKGLDETQARPLFRQVCLGLQHLHTQSITHRDVKPENILVDSQRRVKLCDFGCAIRGTALQFKVSGTLEYLAPEVLLEEGASNKVDCWALGVLLFEMLHGRSPFKGPSDFYTARKIIKARAVFTSAISTEARELVTTLLERDPAKRPSVAEVLRHPWLQEETLFSERTTADASPLLPPQTARQPPRKKMSNLRAQMLLEEREAELLRLQQALEAPQVPQKPVSWFRSLFRRLM